MSTEPTKRPRGRPKGSKNKRVNLSEASVERICEYHKFNPTEKLIRIANNDDGDTQWPISLRYQAAAKLHDSIHNNKSLPGVKDGSSDTQYEIVFLESSDDFELPGEGGPEGAAGVLPETPFQRLGMSSQDGEDCVRHQYDDSQGLVVRED